MDSSQQPHAVGSIIPILESLIRLPRVTTWNQTYMCLISELVSKFSCFTDKGIENNSFLVNHVSYFKDENQVTYLDIGVSPRGIISALWNILYIDRKGADLGVYVGLYPFPMAQKFQVWHARGQVRSRCPLKLPAKQNQRILKLEGICTSSHLQVYLLSTLLHFVLFPGKLMYSLASGWVQPMASPGKDIKERPYPSQFIRLI